MAVFKQSGSWLVFALLVRAVLTAPDYKYFTINYLESALSYDGGPNGPTRQGFIYFNITDAFDLNVNKDGSEASTTCEAFYPVASPPSSLDTGAGCNDIAYTWWFDTYNNATDFSLAVNHRYGRRPGTPGYDVDGKNEKNVNQMNYPKTLVQCGGAGNCYLRYEDEKKPMQLPFYEFNN